MSKKILLIPLFLILIISQAESALDTPNPQGYVNDFAGVIDQYSRAQIEDYLARLEENRSIEIAVVTVKSLEGDEINSYAERLFQKWGIGKKGVDNGLLILIAVDDRQWRIEVGYGLEGSMNDAKAGRIGRNCFTENFRTGEYGKGIFCAVKGISAEIEGNGDKEDEKEIEEGDILLILVFFLIVFVVIIGIAKAAKKTSESESGRKWGYFGTGKGGGGRGGFGGFGGGGSGGGGAGGKW